MLSSGNYKSRKQTISSRGNLHRGMHVFRKATCKPRRDAPWKVLGSIPSLLNPGRSAVSWGEGIQASIKKLERVGEIHFCKRRAQHLARDSYTLKSPVFRVFPALMIRQYRGAVVRTHSLLTVHPSLIALEWLGIRRSHVSFFFYISFLG